MEGNSEKSEELLEDDGEDLDIDSNQVFGIGNTDAESESLFGIEPDSISNDTELVLDIGTHETETDQILEFQTTNQDQDPNSIPPITGMEFDSYDDAYKYYNHYAKELGFGIRVKSSWTKRNSKEKRGAVLCCNCEGFKTLKEASTRRKETRTGCLAMIRLRLIESNRWRVDEVKLEHNHLFDPERAQNSKSHKRADSVKRKFEPIADVEVRTIKLYRTPTVDVLYGSSNEKEIDNEIGKNKRLNLHKGDTKIIQDYFCKVQLVNPNFFYIMDFSEDGYLRNVFWIDSRARASYNYFGDVIALDTTCVKNKFNVPLVVFVGSNHHGQTIPLGFGLLADESQQTYTWLLRAWLTCMAGRPPQTIITDQSTALQTVITEIFPRAHHRLFLPLVIETILENLQNMEPFQSILNSIIYNSVKVDEFELQWEDMINRFSVRDNETLKKTYEDRERWAPVYLKDTFFANMLTFERSTESIVPFFHGYVHRETSLKEFFEMHDLVIQNKIQKEAFDDRESTQSTLKLKTICRYESQLSKIYTKEIFSRFQFEVEMMANCFSVTQVNTSGSIVTYMVSEQESGVEGSAVRNMEVMYDKIGVEVRCICSCFNFRGYLCRHAMLVLSHNGVEEVPGQYVLARWRRDFKRVYVPDVGFGSDSVDVGNPVQWFVHLHKRALQVVEEGMTSQEHYMAAWQAFKESLNKVRLVADKHGQS